MAENLEALARRQDEAWNARDFDSIVELTDPEATITLVGSGEVLRGKEGMRQYSQMWATGFPDGKTSDHTYVTQGNTVVAMSSSAFISASRSTPAMSSTPMSA